MKTTLCALAAFLCFCSVGMAQDTTYTLPPERAKEVMKIIAKERLPKLLEETSAEGCKCVDSISTYDKSNEEVSKEISACIARQSIMYQLLVKMMTVSEEKDSTSMKGEKRNVITISDNENSNEYRKYYYEIERYMTENCPSLKAKVATNDKLGEKSLSENLTAMVWYTKGLEYSKKENFVMAIESYNNAIKEDSIFTFAWDNLGLTYRKLKLYDKAIECYRKSLGIDPKGITALQNIAVVYQYREEHQNAIDAYLRIADIDKDNPEIYYGVGQIYAMSLHEYEKGLDNMCKAYSLYIEQKSPYRTDAEKIINYIYVEMTRQGKEDKFNEILKSHNISPSK